MMVIAAMASIGLTDNFVVKIAEEAGLWQFHLVRSAMALPILLAAALAAGIRFRMVRPWAVAARGVLLAISMLLYFGAIPLMPIALAVAGLFTAPVFVLVFSALFFGVRPGPVRIGAVAAGFLGVVLILNPGEGFEWAVLVPVAGGAAYALAAIVARHWCAQESTVVLLGAFYTVIGLAGAVGLLAFHGSGSEAFGARGWVPPTAPFLFWTFVQAATSVLAVGMLTRAYQMGEPTYLAVFEYTLLVFVSVWAWLLYGQTVTAREVLGMALIVASGALIARRSGQAG